MLGDVDDIRRAMVARVSAAFAEEIENADLAAATVWPLWPTVESLIDHLGRNHLWAAELVRTGRAVDRSTLPRAPKAAVREWYEGCRGEMLAAFDDTDPHRPCWVIGGGTGTAAFWSRRMIYETVKHLVDLRAAGGGAFRPAPELAAVDYVDGIDELFEVFLPRSRPTLTALAGALTLRATDTDRRWTIGPDWAVTTSNPGPSAAEVSGRAGDLALLVWQRADPAACSERLRVEGDAALVASFASAPVHP